MASTQRRFRRGEYTIHRPPRRGRTFVLGFLILDTGVLLYIANGLLRGTFDLPAPGWVALGLAGLVVALLALVAYRYTLGDGIIIAPDGLRFHIQGNSGFVAWEHVDHLETRRKAGFTYAGLVLRTPVGVSRSLLSPPRWLGLLRGDFIPISLVTSLPLDDDDDVAIGALRQMGLGRELLRHAPQIFEYVP